MSDRVQFNHKRLYQTPALRVYAPENDCTVEPSGRVEASTVKPIVVRVQNTTSAGAGAGTLGEFGRAVFGSVCVGLPDHNIKE